jgi:hypothetical protein
MTIDEQTLAELQAKHDELYEITVGEHAVYVKMPSEEAYKVWKRSIMDEKKRPFAGDNLLRTCVVYPDTASFNALLTRRPFLTDAFANRLLELAGANEAGETKKL